MQVRVKKGYVPPEEQQTYDRWKAPADAGGVPGAGDAVQVPKPPMTAAQKKNAKRKEKKAESGAGAPSASAAVVDVSDAPPGLAASAKPAAKPAKKPPAAAPAPAAEAAEGSQPNELEKKLRNLKKKLKAIEELEYKAANGEELQEGQKAKVATKGELEAEITRWEAFADPEELAKEVKKLGKKLRQIEELAGKKEAGEVLNEDQEGKVLNKQKVEEEYKKMQELQQKLKES